MKYCNKCHLEVMGPITYCPLCQNELTPLNTKNQVSSFPDVYETYTSHHTFLKILGFICIALITLTFCAWFLSTINIWWALIIIATIGCVFLSVVTAVIKHRNILKYLLYQSLIICLFALCLDFLTQSAGWSITFVLPIVFTLNMVVMYLLSKILHLHTGDYVIYLLLDALFGMLTLLLLPLSKLKTPIPSLICLLVSVLSVASLLIFEGKVIYGELYRRLHL